MRRIAFACVLSAVVQAALAAETWQWLGKTNMNDDGTTVAYGKACWTTNNWKNVATGLPGIPQSGDRVTAAGVGQFGQNFGASLAFGGVTVTSGFGSEFVSQGTLTLQAGGDGVVLESGVKSVGTLNGSMAFVGSGEAIVDVKNTNCVLFVQKSCYGNANVTLVKRGPGTLRVNDYYRPVGNTRDTTGGYYPNRKFVFGGFRLQEGTFTARQYFTVVGLDFKFDGPSGVLDLCGTNPSASDPQQNAVSWRLKGGGFSETERCAAGGHRVTAQTATGVLELVGTRMDTLFTGAFTGSAGLVWNPDNDAEFVFSKSVSDTTGFLVVSNGTVRLTQGAGFTALQSLEVSGAKAVFRVDDSAACDLGNVPVGLNGGGKISLAATTSVKSLTIGEGGGCIAVTSPQTWCLNTESLDVLGPLGSDNGSVMVQGSRSPGFPNGGEIGCDLCLAKGGAITCPAGKNLTFDGVVTTTNTQSLSISAGAGSTITFNRLMMSRNGGTMSGEGRIIFKDSMHFRDRPVMSGNVTVELHSDGNRLNGNMGTFSGGTLRTMRAYAITRANTKRQSTSSGNQSADADQNTMINAKDGFVLDLNGFDQSIDIIAMHADGTKSGGHVRSATSATLHLQTAASCWPQHNYRYGFSDYASISSTDGYGYETADKGRWEGGVNLSYEAAAGKVRSMMRVSSSTGCVEVVSGKLVFLRRARHAGETFDLKCGVQNPYPRLADEDGAWPLAAAVTVSGGTLKLEHALTFGRDVKLHLKTGGVLELDEGVTLGCQTLSVDGVDLEPGRSYGADDTPCITGKGRVYVRGNRSVFSVFVAAPDGRTGGTAK